MEKVLLWGTGDRYRVEYDRIRYWQRIKKIDVLALVNRNGSPSFLDGHRVISKNEIKKYEYDRIVIIADQVMTESIQNDIRELELDEKKIVHINFFINEVEIGGRETYRRLIQKQKDVLQDILDASDEEIKDYDWMFHKINEYGVYPFRVERDGINWTRFGVLQVIEEFTKYCNFLGGTEGIETAIEVGVAKGRSSYLICALLSRNNPHLSYTLVDICDQLDSFEEFQNILPALKKKIPSISKDYAGKQFDFVFIDADHSYDASMQDYLNIGQYAKVMTCFHDIYAHEYDDCAGGTVRMWKEVLDLTREKEHKVFSFYPEEWMGIGCVIQ